jgi:hypothetical protein
MQNARKKITQLFDQFRKNAKGSEKNMMNATSKLEKNMMNATSNLEKQFKSKNRQIQTQIQKSKNLKFQDIMSNLKNPKTEAGQMGVRILFGLGICCVGMAASLLGLR